MTGINFWWSTPTLLTFGTRTLALGIWMGYLVEASGPQVGQRPTKVTELEPRSPATGSVEIEEPPSRAAGTKT
jgi:hypothetical protein